MVEKTLVCGDLHTKYHIFDKVKELSKNYDKVVFLGDYVDEWNAPPEASYNLLIGLKEFYEENPYKVTLCIGNHEASEGFGKGFRASGYNQLTSDYVYEIFCKFPSIFKVATVEQGFLITHAGLTKSWAEKYLPDYQTPEDYAKRLNQALRGYLDLKPLSNEDEKIFYGLGDVGYYRGGSGLPGPLWADINELLQDPFPEIKQIVGHSPISTVTHFESKGTDLYFCDTHSVYSSLEPIGDNSLLEIIDGQISKISLDGNKISW